MPAARFEIHLFGPFRLLDDGRPVPGFEQARVQHLLAYLVLHANAPVSRHQLAFAFWPETTDPQAHKNLRTLLARLRRALPRADQFVDVTAQTIQWRPDAPATVDTIEFERAFEQAAMQPADDPARVTGALRAAVAAYAGDLLPDCYDDWILPLREQLSKTYGAALEQLILLLEAQAEYHESLAFAARLLQHDPLHEAAYQHLMRLHLAVGARTEALRVYRAAEAMLAQEFGARPGRPLQELYERAHASAEARPPGLAAAPSAAGPLPSAALPLVGRKAEWKRLMDAWCETATGRPRLVLLTGEAGIGKTRLAEELCAWAATRGVTVAAAHCYPEGAGVAAAYAPVGEWLRHASLRPRLGALSDVWLAEISRIVPMLLTERPQLSPEASITGAWQRTRLFEALARAVLGMNSGNDSAAPLLLFLDDLQWCDQETLDWLGYLLRFAARAPLLVLATVRKDEVDRVHPLMTFWLSLTRAGLLEELLLRPLDAAETAVLAASVTGRTLNAAEAAQIYHDTEGNPLFVIETVRAGPVQAQEGIAGDGMEEPPQVVLPSRVRAVIQWRLAQLSPSAQALAQIAAAIGRQFNFALLAQASGQDETLVLEGLDELWRRHLVQAEGSATYSFSHEDIRTVAYDELGPVRGRAIHLRIARALEALHGQELDASGEQVGRQLAPQLAYHYERAGQVQPAVAYYRLAAAAAQRVYANAVAASFYRRLLEGELSGGLPAPERCTVMLALAEAWRGIGEWTRAEALSRDALALAETLGEPHMVAQAQAALGDMLQLLGYYDMALDWLARAEQGFRALDDRRGLVGVLRIAAETHWRRGALSPALAVLERQLAIATEIDDAAGIADALQKTGTVLWSRGELERAAANCLQAIALATPLEHKPVLTGASLTLADIRFAQQQLVEALDWYRRAAGLAREIGDGAALTRATSGIASIAPGNPLPG